MISLAWAYSVTFIVLCVKIFFSMGSNAGKSDVTFSSICVT